MKTVKIQVVVLSGLFALLLQSPAPAQKISPSLQQALSRGAKGTKYICWVTLADKPGAGYKSILEKRSLDRRQKLGRTLSYGDLPVSGKYIEAIKKSGTRIRVISPWLNAVSVMAGADQIAKLAELPYVARLDLVARFRAEDELKTAKPAGSKSLSALDYGYADGQIKLLNINDLHAKGYTGSGIRILIIDTGFDRQHEALLRTSVVAERDFQRMVHPRDQNGDEDTLALRPDSITSFEQDQDSTRQQTNHGTGMLSIIGGYKSGSLIGSAYNADFVLAKTEKLTGSDFYLEEDWWVAALQWGDSLGVDIATSSLGYRQWGDTTVRASYTYGQMNGDVAFCSRAADSAVSRGIVVLNSNGNTSNNTRPDTCLIAPADGDSVIAVGGVRPTDRLWANPSVGNGASTGPAADSIKIQRFGGSDSLFIRRIKPDIASAWQTYFANNKDTVNYSEIVTSPGTSGACALTAGLCALLLEAHPTWGPKQVMDALKHSGSNKATMETFLAHPESLSTELGIDPNYNPGFDSIATGHKYYIDNTGTIHDFYDVYRIGWGIPDGLAALNYTAPEVAPPESDQLLDPYPNPAKPGDAGIYLPYFLARDSYNITIRIYTLDGRMLRQMDYGTQLAGEYPGQRQPRQSLLPITGGRPGGYWDMKDDKGQPAPSGLYLVILSTGWNQSVKKVVVVR
ncbi:S8 family serine peptidase [candidate division TA06 bacterium]|uniref:S8 family serine peptidase n=1 Tax=candidate division TA06 bacterium TaxID=2250710 RepID=A0A933IBK8_UNCT6|nr:S8 family serine peptidase [candidate division TA06 bacterium]